MTGILSDIAGLVVAPLVVQAAWEVASWAVGRWRGPSMAVLSLSIVSVGVGFAAVQLWPSATDAYRVGLGILQWPVRALLAVLDGSTLPAIRPVVAVGDVGDLLALPALTVTGWLGRRRLEQAS